MAPGADAPTRIIAATNRSDFNALKTTSDRYPAALARWAILPAWSLTSAGELQTDRKNLHESALKKFAVHFSVSSPLRGEGDRVEVEGLLTSHRRL